MSRYYPLSPRECECLNRLALGESFKWIGHELGISENSAQTLAKRAYKKIGVSGRWEVPFKHPWHEPTPSRPCNVGVTRPSR